MSSISSTPGLPEGFAPFPARGGVPDPQPLRNALRHSSSRLCGAGEERRFAMEDGGDSGGMAGAGQPWRSRRATSIAV